MSLISFIQPSTGNFLVNIIRWLIQISSSIAVGVILFTIILKLITLPFDFFSRVSMRKNSLKMEQMRPELEKLQKQYANDKALYNQKMMALYKKNGYSMWGACLPTIITLVIFIVAINAFTSYSRYQNREYFYNMSVAYNNAIYAGLETDGNLIKIDGDTYVIDYNGIYEAYKNKDASIEGEKELTNEQNPVKIIVDNKIVEDGYEMTIKTANGYIEHVFNYTLDEQGKFVLGTHDKFNVIENSLSNENTVKNELNNNLKVVVDGVAVGYGDEYKTSRAKQYIAEKNEEIEEYNEKVDDGKEEGPKKALYTENDIDTVKNTVINGEYFLTEICQDKSAESFKSVNKRFLWVKNIWVTDAPTSHPIVSTWKKFTSEYKYKGGSNDKMSEDAYSELIAKLDAEKSQPNGYFILAILTAGISFLTQFVLSKSQKSQMELQTVDGQGARTQKFMMWLMPIMMAFFSFMYTAAFSIYMFISSVFSILTTLGINWVVDKKFAKIAAKNEGDGKIRGRIHVEESKPEPKKEKKVKDKKDEGEVRDFMNGSSKTKHVRGRLK